MTGVIAAAGLLLWIIGEAILLSVESAWGTIIASGLVRLGWLFIGGAVLLSILRAWSYEERSVGKPDGEEGS